MQQVGGVHLANDSGFWERHEGRKDGRITQTQSQSDSRTARLEIFQYPIILSCPSVFPEFQSKTRILESDSMQPTSNIPSADSPTPAASKVERAAGTTFLPIARVKRIIKEDKDVSLINAEATFCVAYATVCRLSLGWRL